jgi:cytoskeleton protein RodZ
MMGKDVKSRRKPFSSMTIDMEHNMNSTTIDNENISEIMQPGAYLALEREKRGISIEQIATKLNLRVQVLSFLETDQYDQLPQPVFVQGYIRAYCKYLGIQPDEVIEAYIAVKPQENRSDKYLWQNQEHPNKNEKWLYWMTMAFVVVSVVSVSMWVYENKSSQNNIQEVLKTKAHKVKTPSEVSQNGEHAVKFSDLSKMRSLLSSAKQDNFSPKDME